MTTEEIISRLEDVIQSLAEWLVDNTDEVFEEQPEIDDARGQLIDLQDELRKTLGAPPPCLQHSSTSPAG